MDRIRINGLKAEAIIGTMPEERVKRQEIIVSATLEGDFSEAGRTDDLSLTADYSKLERELISIAENSRFKLLEAMAEAMAAACLAEERVRNVVISIEKPHAPVRARSVSVEIERSKNCDSQI